MSLLPDQPEDRLLSVTEAADLLQISAYTLREWARDRRVPAIRVGRYWRFRQSALWDWLRDRERVAR